MKEQYERSSNWQLNKFNKPDFSQLKLEQNCAFNIYHKKEQMSGWLFIAFTAGSKSVEIQTSYAFSPYQDLAYFLEDILLGNLPKSIEIDEEGREKFLYAYPAESENAFYFVITNDEWEVLLAALCDRHQFADQIVNTLKHFIKEQYNASAWSLYLKDVDLKDINLDKIEQLLAK